MIVPVKEYVWARTAWLEVTWRTPEVEDEILLTVHGSGYSANFAVRWHRIGRDRVCPRVEAFSDAWKGLEQISFALANLDNKNPTPEEFIREIERYGFVPGEYHGQLTDRRKMSVSSLQKAGKDGDAKAVDELARRLLRG